MAFDLTKAISQLESKLARQEEAINATKAHLDFLRSQKPTK